MAWSQTAPTLPDGKNWEQEQTTAGSIQTLYHMHWTAKIARLKGNQIAIYVKEWCTKGSAAQSSWFSPPSTFGVTVAVNGIAGEEEALTAGTQYAAVEWYYTGNAPSGATVTLSLNDGLSSVRTLTFTAPDADGDVLYLNVGGTWKQASAVYVKSSGAWKEGQLKIKSEGAWK